MQSLLVPFLAQLLTVGAGASTEARDVIELGQQRFEGSASAGVGFNLQLPYLSMAVGYSPGVTVSPLFDTPREVTYSDTLSARAETGYTFRFRRTSLTLRQAGGYTVQNPVLQARAGPPPAQQTFTPVGGNTGGQATAPPQDGTAAADQRAAQNYRMQTWSLYSSVGFERQLSRVTTFETGGGYSFGAGIGRARQDNPLVQGPDARIDLRYDVSRRDHMTTSLVGQYRFSEVHDHGQIVLLGERWGHDFSRRTQAEIGAGLSYTREWHGDGVVTNGIYPAGLANIIYSTRLARGTFTFSAGAVAAPVLDVTSASVDPRLGAGAGVGWTRRRLTLDAQIGTAISFDPDPNGRGALNTLSANAGLGYDLGSGFRFNTGVRNAWEKFEGITVVNPQTIIYVGIGWGGETTLIEPKGRKPPPGPGTR